jgi:membrane associated rhomboid family serine protease
MQRTSNKYSASPFARYYKDNAVLQLIMALGTAFVTFHFTIAIMRIMHFPERQILDTVVDYTTLPALSGLKYKIWTVFSYSLFHIKQVGINTELGFWSMFSNMIWLYCFGSLVQMMVGHRHVIPMFFYSTMMGGVFYLLAQYVPAWAAHPDFHIGGAQAGIVGLAAAAVTIAPNYRFYLAPHFSLPMLLVVSIFGVLMMLYVGFMPAHLVLLTGGGLMGFLYITLLRRGVNMSEWIYRLFSRVERSVTPKEDAYMKHNYRRNEVLNATHKKKAALEQRVDEILDKINNKGYDSLTKEEKEILLQAGKDNE